MKIDLNNKESKKKQPNKELLKKPLEKKWKKKQPKKLELPWNSTNTDLNRLELQLKKKPKQPELPLLLQIKKKCLKSKDKKLKMETLFTTGQPIAQFFLEKSPFQPVKHLFSIVKQPCLKNLLLKEKLNSKMHQTSNSEPNKFGSKEVFWKSEHLKTQFKAKSLSNSTDCPLKTESTLVLICMNLRIVLLSLENSLL